MIARRPRSVATASRRPSGDAPLRASRARSAHHAPFREVHRLAGLGRRRRDRGGAERERPGHAPHDLARRDPITWSALAAPDQQARRRRRRTPDPGTRARRVRAHARPPPPRAPRGSRCGRERAGCPDPPGCRARHDQELAQRPRSLRSRAIEASSPARTRRRPPVQVRKYGGSPPVTLRHVVRGRGAGGDVDPVSARRSRPARKSVPDGAGTAASDRLRAATG